MNKGTRYRLNFLLAHRRYVHHRGRHFRNDLDSIRRRVLQYLSWQEFADTWVTERTLTAQARRGTWQGPIPDALLQTTDVTRAIEIGGYYSADWLRHHVTRFEAAGWEWEIW